MNPMKQQIHNINYDDKNNKRKRLDEDKSNI